MGFDWSIVASFVGCCILNPMGLLESILSLD
jgi:hypothetical protein